MGGMESQIKYSPASQPTCVDFQLPTPLLSGTPPGTRGLSFCRGGGGGAGKGESPHSTLALHSSVGAWV